MNFWNDTIDSVYKQRGFEIMASAISTEQAERCATCGSRNVAEDARGQMRCRRCGKRAEDA